VAFACNIGSSGKVLGVSPSGYSVWKRRPESARAYRHRHLIQEIRVSFRESGETYGALRVTEDLREAGERVGKNTVARLMQRERLVPKQIRKFRVTTDSRKTTAHPNRLKQQFEVNAPNRVWASDLTAIPTREGWLYLCVFLDLCSRAVIGWSMASRMKGELVTDALDMALANRALEGPVLVHSDQGSQYAADRYQRRLSAHGMTCSMSRKGNGWDNAVAESFFHSLKTERTHHEKYPTRTQAKMRVFDYIGLFYNRRRRHSRLGYKAPMVFEEQFN